MPATKHATIQPDMLERVGRALYGENWIAAIARDLDMHRRSVEYMRDGTRGIKPGIVEDLISLIEDRGAELHDVAKELRRALKRVSAASA